MAGPGDLLALLHIFDWLKEKFGAKVETPAKRFVEVFESHGIHRNQIPRYLPDLLSLSDVQNDQSLSKVLNQEMIDKAADLFKVDTAWIECASAYPYRPLDFYKRPEKFIHFIEDLLTSGSDLDGVVYTFASPKSGHHADTFILLEETIELPSELRLTRYYILNNWFFNYGKSRAYLTACVAAAWNKKVYLQGRRVSQEFVEKYQSGKTLFYLEDIEPLPGQHWPPENMALDPDILIEGLGYSHNQELALTTFTRLLAKDKRYSLENMGSVEQGIPFQEALASLDKQE